MENVKERLRNHQRWDGGNREVHTKLRATPVQVNVTHFKGAYLSLGVHPLPYTMWQ